MDIKDARSRLATARTAMQKADSILDLCEQMDRYSAFRSQLDMVRREIHQQVGRVDLMYNILQSVENTAPEED